jgi:hypothetical protein
MFSRHQLKRAAALAKEELVRIGKRWLPHNTAEG